MCLYLCTQDFSQSLRPQVQYSIRFGYGACRVRTSTGIFDCHFSCIRQGPSVCAFRPDDGLCRLQQGLHGPGMCGAIHHVGKHACQLIVVAFVECRQYFLWYTSFLPLILPSTSIRFRWKGLAMILAWFAGEVRIYAVVSKLNCLLTIGICAFASCIGCTGPSTWK